MSQTHAATSVLAAALYGLSTIWDDVKADELVGEGTKVSAKVFAPTGDVYHVTVEWVKEESP